MAPKFFITLLLSIILIPAVMAQQGFQLGTTTTLNATFIINQNDYGIYTGTPIGTRTTMAYQYTWGYNLGLQAGYNFNKRFGLITSVTDNEGGQHFADTYFPLAINVGYHVERQVDLNYLQVPLFFKYNFGPYGRRVQIYAMTGPELGFLLNASDNIWINDVPQTNALPASQRYRKLDVGWGAGLGVDIYIRQDLYFEIGGLGYIGLTDFNSNNMNIRDWVGDHSTIYQASYNFHPGLDIGIHFLFNKESHNPFNPRNKNADKPIVPAKTT